MGEPTVKSVILYIRHAKAPRCGLVPNDTRLVPGRTAKFRILVESRCRIMREIGLNFVKSLLNSYVERFPIIAVIVLCQQTINVAWLEPTNVRHVQINQLRRNVVMNWIDEVHLL